MLLLNTADSIWYHNKTCILKEQFVLAWTMSNKAFYLIHSKKREIKQKGRCKLMTIFFTGSSLPSLIKSHIYLLLNYFSRQERTFESWKGIENNKCVWGTCQNLSSKQKYPTFLLGTAWTKRARYPYPRSKVVPCWQWADITLTPILSSSQHQGAKIWIKGGGEWYDFYWCHQCMALPLPRI